MARWDESAQLSGAGSDAESDAESDDELVERARSGDGPAYAELWRRHHRAGLAMAQSFTDAFDADDLVSEAFARILVALSRGGGPSAGFRPYLFTSIRNIAARWGRQGAQEIAVDDAESIEDPRSSKEAVLAALDRSLAAEAFQGLEPQWQKVLWYTEVKALRPREVAPLLGMSANAVSALAYRAREKLRAAWITAHLDQMTEEREPAHS